MCLGWRLALVGPCDLLGCEAHSTAGHSFDPRYQPAGPLWVRSLPNTRDPSPEQAESS